MGKVFVNGKEVEPTKKVKLTEHMKKTDITKMLKHVLKKQREERANEESGS